MEADMTYDPKLRRVVVEGMDGSGKTTLIERLTRQFHYLSMVPGGRRPNITEWWQDQLKPNETEYVPIHDRFFYSELVYGKVLRGRIEGSMDLLSSVDKHLRTYCLLIYCRPPDRVIERSLKETGSTQMEGVT